MKDIQLSKRQKPAWRIKSDMHKNKNIKKLVKDKRIYTKNK